MTLDTALTSTTADRSQVTNETVLIMEHERFLAPYNADCQTEVEPYLCIHSKSVEDSEKGRSAAGAYTNMMVADDFNPGSIDQPDHMKIRSDRAVALLTGGGPLPGSLRAMTPAEDFSGISYLSIQPSCWKEWTGEDPKDDIPCWFPRASRASGRLISLKDCDEPKCESVS